MKKEIVCKLGKTIAVTEERLIHLIFRHPEMQNLENEIINMHGNSVFGMPKSFAFCAL